MKQLRNKLRSRRGASLLISMVAFLVAAMVSVVIVDASLTALRRVHSQEAREQDYLTVSSAARLLRTCLETSSYTVETTTYLPSEGDEEDGGEPPDPITGSSCQGPLGEFLGQCLESFRDNRPLDGNTGLTLTVEGLADVTISGFKMEETEASTEGKGYRISGCLATEDGVQKIYFVATVREEPMDTTNGMDEHGNNFRIDKTTFRCEDKDILFDTKEFAS